MKQEQRKYHYDASTEKECNQILQSIERQVFYIDRLLGRVQDLKKQAAGLDTTYIFLSSARGSMREAHDSLHYEMHGVKSGKWRHERDIRIEKQITGERD